MRLTEKHIACCAPNDAESAAGPLVRMRRSVWQAPAPRRTKDPSRGSTPRRQSACPCRPPHRQLWPPGTRKMRTFGPRGRCKKYGRPVAHWTITSRPGSRPAGQSLPRWTVRRIAATSRQKRPDLGRQLHLPCEKDDGLRRSDHWAFAVRRDLHLVAKTSGLHSPVLYGPIRSPERRRCPGWRSPRAGRQAI
jgi:hypothetical protein